MNGGDIGDYTHGTRDIHDTGAITGSNSARRDAATPGDPDGAPSAGADAVRATVAASRTVQPEWGRTAVRDRAAFAARIRRTVARAGDEIADVVAAQTGRPRAAVLMAEVSHAAAHADFLARNAELALATRRVSARPVPTKRAWLSWRPLGVAGVITPANYPFLLPFLSTTTALTAGCAVVLKPSELCPGPAHLLVGLLARAGLPDGLVRVVEGGPETGAALLNNGGDGGGPGGDNGGGLGTGGQCAGGVDVLAVTGSTPTGRAVAQAAARSLTPVIGELGGKDVMIVCGDADLRRAARCGLWSACFNAGASCVSVERVYVVDAACDAFVAELDRAVRDLAAGGERRDIGPLPSAAHAEHVRAQIADAVAKGAAVRHGGRSRTAGGRVWFEPTVLTGVDDTMDVARFETFGPVLPVIRVADADEAVLRANGSGYGLAASVWTRQEAVGAALAARLRVGAVAVNDAMVNYAIPGLPFGGLGWSGRGPQGGVDGIRAYCHAQSVTTNRVRLPRDPQWYPQLPAPAWSRFARWRYGR